MKARLESYLRTAAIIIAQYEGTLPFQHHLKQYFSAHKKHGSNDRKSIAHCCYCYFRLGKAASNLSFDERVRLAIFLCNNQPGKWAELYKETYLQNWSESLEKRILSTHSFYSEFNIAAIFPCHTHVAIADNKAFIVAHLVQPLLFLRIRPGKKAKVLQQLAHHNIAFTMLSENTLALENTTTLQGIINLNSDAVVQDYSSQQTGNVLLENIQPASPLTVWDCCTASGGKAIMAFDILKNIQLTVSDVRATIIENLKKRFKEAGITQYKAFIADLTVKQHLPKQQFDLIICDAPCSGSGTWGRTPEQLVYFDERKISHYVQLQKTIAVNAASCLKKNGHFLYITCSVFKEENEEVVAFIQHTAGLNLLHMQSIEGYMHRADTMFMALFSANI